MRRLLPLLAALLLLTSLGAAERQPGLAVTFLAGGKTDVRADRLLALYVPAGQAPTPFLAPGPFTVRWEGEIQSPVRGTFTFAAESSGGFKLSLNGQPLLDGPAAKTVTLNQGGNKLVAELPAAAQGDTFVRLTWSSKDFLPEPVPPTVLSHEPAAPELAAARVREGRLLFAQLNCAACHADAAKLPAKGSGLPELGQNAPVLADLGSRFNPHFLTEWIHDPKSFRPGTLMPKALTGPDAAQQAADIAAMLTQGATPPAGKLDAAQVAPGGALFANLGCIGCHQRPDAEVDGKPETLGRIPLAHLTDKYQQRAAALADYLRDPAKHYPATRMPNFRLNEEESGQLANYLLANGRMIKRQPLKGDPTRGAALLVSAGCLNCHAGMPPTTQPPLAKVLAAGAKGCLAPDAGRAAAPDFGLTPAQRESLLAFLATDLASLKQDTPAEFAERQVRNLNCAACHARDGQGSAWSKVDGECKKLRDALPPKEHVEGEPVPDAPIPAMTWFGEKLQTSWMTKFVSGQVETKPRPWLIGRMPGFAHVATGLSLGLAHQHGLPAEEPKEDAPKAELTALGEKLIGVDGGFNCITCHAVGDTPATAVFEAPAINFKQTAERLRRGYFLRWALAPVRLDPETKMPKYADAEGMTQLTDILDGKGAEQFEAVRQYLRTLEGK